MELGVTVSEEGEKEVPKRTVKFQCGLLRETETFVGDDVEELCRDSLQEFVCDMLNVKVGRRPSEQVYYTNFRTHKQT